MGHHLSGDPQPPRLSAAHGDERLDRCAAPPRDGGSSPHHEFRGRPGSGLESRDVERDAGCRIRTPAAALTPGASRREGAAAACRPLPSPELIDRFIERYNAKDVPGLVALLLDGGSAENVGNSFHIGADPSEGTPRVLHAVVHGHAEWPREFQRDAARIERVEFEGEPIALAFRTHKGREALESIYRFEEQDGRIARFRSYAFCPETIRAVGEALGVRVRTGIYRAPTPAPGTGWPDPAFPRPRDPGAAPAAE